MLDIVRNDAEYLASVHMGGLALATCVAAALLLPITYLPSAVGHVGATGADYLFTPARPTYLGALSLPIYRFRW